LSGGRRNGRADGQADARNQRGAPRQHRFRLDHARHAPSISPHDKSGKGSLATGAVLENAQERVE
jgi:hypothetical protein